VPSGARAVRSRPHEGEDIRLVEGDHDTDCKILGFGAMKLKSEIVRKA